MAVSFLSSEFTKKESSYLISNLLYDRVAINIWRKSKHFQTMYSSDS